MGTQPVPDPNNPPPGYPPKPGQPPPQPPQPTLTTQEWLDTVATKEPQVFANAQE